MIRARPPAPQPAATGTPFGALRRS